MSWVASDRRPDASPLDPEWDFVVVGGGIAGAAVAYELASVGRTCLLERESQPGYHATGRSAALYAASYGPAPVRALTRASRSFFEHPPVGFAAHPLLHRRGVLFIAEPGQEAVLASLHGELGSDCPTLELLDADAATSRLPVLRRERTACALSDPDVFDLDAYALHQGYLRGLRGRGGTVRCDAGVSALSREAAAWTVSVGSERLTARMVINAAGAWCDEVASLAGLRGLGMQPRRRSAFVFAGPPDRCHQHWPMAVGVSEDWYLKPDAAQWLASPANADDTVAQDVQPEELDIALGVHRIEEVTTLQVGRPLRTWAGLRTFAPDGLPVVGLDPRADGFLWLGGLGGYGIQTAPALGKIAAALACGDPPPRELAHHGVDIRQLCVERLLSK